jgi:dimeric dUTPase (all-alpha-NTP-PPase superfamily)
MNLQKLFEAQRKLDEHIIREKGLEGHDLLPQKILALQVELGELANEWRGFKYWSNRQSPDQPEYNWRPSEDGSCLEAGQYDYASYPLLEEYVDCLHFILSIGLDLGVDISTLDELGLIYQRDVMKQFLRTMECALNLNKRRFVDWFVLAERFNGLGKVLGFTWEHIEEAYFAKNRINHERQESGY